MVVMCFFSWMSIGYVVHDFVFDVPLCSWSPQMMMSPTFELHSSAISHIVLYVCMVYDKSFWLQILSPYHEVEYSNIVGRKDTNCTCVYHGNLFILCSIGINLKLYDIKHFCLHPSSKCIVCLQDGSYNACSCFHTYMFLKYLDRSHYNTAVRRMTTQVKANTVNYHCHEQCFRNYNPCGQRKLEDSAFCY